MKMIRFVALAPLLCGCARHYTRPPALGGCCTQFKQDEARCALTFSGWYMGLLGLAVYESQKKEHVHNYLLALGYQEVGSTPVATHEEVWTPPPDWALPAPMQSEAELRKEWAIRDECKAMSYGNEQVRRECLFARGITEP